MTIPLGNLIILNGVSSAGKTTIARALQKLLPEPYLWVANDTFCDMYPDKFWEQDWVAAINHALSAMIYAAQAFSNRGYHVIVDQVFLNNDTEGGLLQKCVEALHDYPVLFVRVDCPLEELEHRERLRGDRPIGQARYQLALVHNHELYDCAIDTSACTPDENAALIRSMLKKPLHDRAFRLLKQRLDQTGSIYPQSA